MAGCHHWLDGCESEWTPGDGDGQGGLVCCDSRGRKESDTTEGLNWTELNGRIALVYPCLFAVKTSAVLWQWGTEHEKENQSREQLSSKQKEPGSCQTTQVTPDREPHPKATLGRVPCYSQLNSLPPARRTDENPQRSSEVPPTARWYVTMSNYPVAYLPHYPDSKEQNKGLEFCKTYNGSKENYAISQGHQRKKKTNQIHSVKACYASGILAYWLFSFKINQSTCIIRIFLTHLFSSEIHFVFQRW